MLRTDATNAGKRARILKETATGGVEQSGWDGVTPSIYRIVQRTRLDCGEDISTKIVILTITVPHFDAAWWMRLPRLPRSERQNSVEEHPAARYKLHATGQISFPHVDSGRDYRRFLRRCCTCGTPVALFRFARWRDTEARLRS